MAERVDFSWRTKEKEFRESQKFSEKERLQFTLKLMKERTDEKERKIIIIILFY